MRIDSSRSILLVIDLQTRLLPAIDQGAAVLDQAAWLVDLAQLLEVPVLATEHCPERIGLTDAGLRARFPASAIVEKTHFSAVAGGDLLPRRPVDREQWVVAGTEAHVCVLQTVLDLLAAGQTVFVVDEAVGSRQPRDKALALARMRQQGAVIVSREMVAFEWLARADAPLFREVLRRFIRND